MYLPLINVVGPVTVILGHQHCQVKVVAHGQIMFIANFFKYLRWSFWQLVLSWFSLPITHAYLHVNTFVRKDSLQPYTPPWRGERHNTTFLYKTNQKFKLKGTQPHYRQGPRSDHVKTKTVFFIIFINHVSLLGLQISRITHKTVQPVNVEEDTAQVYTTNCFIYLLLR